MPRFPERSGCGGTEKERPGVELRSERIRDSQLSFDGYSTDEIVGLDDFGAKDDYFLSVRDNIWSSAVGNNFGSPLKPIHITCRDSV